MPGTTRWEAAGVRVDAVTEQPLDADGQLRLVVEGGWTPPRLDADEAALPPGARRELGAVVLGGLPPGPVLRPRRPGDRVTTSGGTRKLQDVFVPVLAAGEQVLWVPGVEVDAELLERGRAAPQIALVVRSLAGP
jgi:hypothetical protein